MINESIPHSIRDAINSYLDMVKLSRSRLTAETYMYGLIAFSDYLNDQHPNMDQLPIQELSEDEISKFALHLKDYTVATEHLYLQAVLNFYEFLAAERLSTPNLPRVRLLIKQRTRRQGQRLPQFPRENIETTIDYAINLAHSPVTEEVESLRNLRDRAFILTLADTGLRVHEACGLQRGDLDWNEGKALIIGKGDRQAIVRFSSRSMGALRDYLGGRAALDGASGKPLASLPLFARHDKGAGNKVKGMTTTTGRNIISQRVREALGDQYLGKITPHSFRHYFVTTILRASGGNLKVAQELARHRNIAVTQRYAHLSDDDLDQAYFQMFDEK